MVIWSLLGLVAPKRAVVIELGKQILFAATGVFSNSLRSFADSVLCQFTGQQKSDGGLDLAGANGWLLVVVSQAGWLDSYTFEDVVNKRVHNAHGFAWDAGIGVNLL